MGQKAGARKITSGATKVKTKDVLLQVTVDQINKVGEAHVRLEDILAESGASVSSLYHHFGNMRGLLDEAQLMRFDADTGLNIRNFRDRVMGCRDADEFRALVIATATEIYSPQRARNRSMLMNAFGSIFETPGYHERVVALENENISVLTEAMQHAKDQRFITTDVDPRALAVWVIGLTFSRVIPDLLEDRAAHEGWVGLTISSFLHLMGLDPEH